MLLSFILVQECGCLVENEFLQHMFLWTNEKNTLYLIQLLHLYEAVVDHNVL